MEPYCPSMQLAVETKETPSGPVAEPTIAALDAFLAKANEAQIRLSAVPVDDRLEVFDQLGRKWEEQASAGMLTALISDMARSTGYSEGLMASEMRFITAALARSNLESNLMATLLGGPEALEGYVEVGEAEFYLHRPAGPSLIVASGNSIVPVLIPTVLSLVTGNVTVLKPSLANYAGVRAVLSLLDIIPFSPARDAVREALMIAYLRTDGVVLDHALAKANFGVVNFWGGEPARGLVAQKVAANPHRPKFFANGPMTGVALVHQDAATDNAASGLALNVILYDQQLCSSPTLALFIGEHAQAIEFAKKVGVQLDAIGGTQQMKMGEGLLFSLQNFRRTLQVRGAMVLSGKSQDNSWTISMGKGRSMLDEAVIQYPHMALHGRRRFLEIVSVPSLSEAIAILRSLPSLKAYAGIDKVQTVGMALTDSQEAEVSLALANAGVYRIMPVDNMFMRSGMEPYDGISLASLFTYTVYRRSKSISLEEQR